MVIYKQFIGEFDSTSGKILYYMIQDNENYGIELVEDRNTMIKSTVEWFTNSKENAIEIAKLLCHHGALPIHLGEIIDNYVS